MRLSVIVMPHRRAASSVCNQRYLIFLVFSGCRIGVRHDNYREPQLLLNKREFDIRECYSILTSRDQLVTVIPRSDAESSDDSRIFLMLFVLDSASERVDSASERGMTVTNRLFEIQNHINYLISKKDYSYIELTLNKKE